MDLLIQIGLIIIAIAFIILMYSIIQTMKVLKAAIEEMRLMITQVRTDVSHISGDMKEAIQNTNAMTLDIRTKLNSLNILFTTVNDIGQTLHAFTGVAKASATKVAATMQRARTGGISNDSTTDSTSGSTSGSTSDSTSGSNSQNNRSDVTSAIIDGVISTLRIVKKIKRI